MLMMENLLLQKMEKVRHIYDISQETVFPVKFKVNIKWQ